MPTVFHQTDVDGVFRSLTNYLHFLCESSKARPTNRATRTLLHKRSSRELSSILYVLPTTQTFTMVKTIQSNPSIKRFSQRFSSRLLKRFHLQVLCVSQTAIIFTITTEKTHLLWPKHSGQNIEFRDIFNISKVGSKVFDSKRIYITDYKENIQKIRFDFSLTPSTQNSFTRVVLT